MALAFKLPIAKKDNSPKSKGELGAKFRAWWNGTEYHAPIDGEGQETQDGAPPIAENQDKIEETAASIAPAIDKANETPETKQLNLEESLREVNAILADDGNDNQSIDDFGDEQVGSNPSVKIIDKNPHKIEKNENEAYIEACEILWGVGRLSPTTNELDEFVLSLLAQTKADNIAIFGNDLGARARIGATIFEKANAYEKGKDFKKHIEKSLNSVKNCKFHSYDEKPGSVPKNNSDALYMAFCGTRIKDVESHIFAAERILKPNGIGIWFDFVKMHDGYDKVKCAGNEGREFVSGTELKSIFDAAGLSIIEEYDHTKEFSNGYDRVNNFLNDDWATIQARLMEWGGISAANIALEQVLVWRSRAFALKSGHLVLKRYNFKRS